MDCAVPARMLVSDAKAIRLVRHFMCLSASDQDAVLEELSCFLLDAAEYAAAAARVALEGPGQSLLAIGGLV